MLSGFTSADADTGLQALAWQHEADHSLWTRPEVEAPKTWQVNRSGLQPRRIVEWCDLLHVFFKIIELLDGLKPQITNLVVQLGMVLRTVHPSQTQCKMFRWLD